MYRLLDEDDSCRRSLCKFVTVVLVLASLGGAVSMWIYVAQLLAWLDSGCALAGQGPVAVQIVYQDPFVVVVIGSVVFGSVLLLVGLVLRCSYRNEYDVERLPTWHPDLAAYVGVVSTFSTAPRVLLQYGGTVGIQEYNLPTMQNLTGSRTLAFVVLIFGAISLVVGTIKALWQANRLVRYSEKKVGLLPATAFLFLFLLPIGLAVMCIVYTVQSLQVGVTGPLTLVSSPNSAVFTLYPPGPCDSTCAAACPVYAGLVMNGTARVNITGARYELGCNQRMFPSPDRWGEVPAPTQAALAVQLGAQCVSNRTRANPVGDWVAVPVQLNLLGAWNTRLTLALHINQQPPTLLADAKPARYPSNITVQLQGGSSPWLSSVSFEDGMLQVFNYINADETVGSLGGIRIDGVVGPLAPPCLQSRCTSRDAQGRCVISTTVGVQLTLQRQWFYCTKTPNARFVV